MWEVKMGSECEDIVQEDIIVPAEGCQYINEQKLSTEDSANSNTDSMTSQHMVMYKQNSMPP
jgi:hypothetical protein